MPGIQASIASDLNLILQLIVLTVLLVGFKYGRKKKQSSLRRHEMLMRSMVVLNIVGAVTVMIPSFISAFNVVANEPAKIGFPLIFVHATLGSIAVSLGIVLSFRKFGNVRIWMRFNFVLWLAALLLGVFIYVGYYILGFPT